MSTETVNATTDETTEKKVNPRSKEALGVGEDQTVVNVPFVLDNDFREAIMKLARNAGEEKISLFKYISDNLGLEKFLLDQTAEVMQKASEIVDDTPSAYLKITSKEEGIKKMEAMKKRMAALKAALTEFE